MKISLVLGALGSLALGVFWPQTIPTALKPHADTLNAAQSLTGKLMITPVGGAAEEATLTFSKPNFFKVESASGFSLYDGKNLYAYDAVKKTYSETAVEGKEAALTLIGATSSWAWTPFFTPDGFKDVTGATRGKATKIRGVELTPVALTFAKPGRTVTIYMDDKMGVAKGLSFKEGDKDMIIMATELVVGKDPLPESTFAFTAPIGATKADPNAAPEAPTFKQVGAILTKSCMPCHNAQNHRANYNFSSYDAVMSSPGAVKTDNPDESFIIRSLKGDRAQRMPQGRAALPAAQIKLIYDWMKAGAKND